ncbi:GMC family oxidoreductase [Paraconexibacter antarcticus]|uniref:Cholesterol oxidase n=1 Tax=Paraconexibacter antarcticus TaxID=2949664 RepID=A0ABY5DZP1_9ACTN|nr:GMC family oxidoreductase [Paraconexibacter antarcticus]UTI66691.1 GMC family oxidoreductase [Paraconexibacter antarcticus]
MTDALDYDWLVIGSGFGGSVSALRLTEKGYRVGIVECGRRFADDEFAERLTQLRRSVWMPRLGMKGILRLTAFKDVMILSGSGVGGGSLVYAQTLYRAGEGFFERWREVSGSAPSLDEYYDTAERMLGVVTHPRRTEMDGLLQGVAADMGAPDSFHPTRVGVYYGTPGVTVDDPYFGGEGPARAGCIECGQCLIGCRENAKNTLPKNYLWFAEKRGADVLAERTVVGIEPLNGTDGATGYRVTSERTGAWLRKDRQTHTARGVVVAAGALGTNLLLARCKHGGMLPRLSDRLGHLVRTNSESLTAVTVPEDRGWGTNVTITGSIHPDEVSHSEACTYGTGGDLMGLLFTLMTPDGTRLTRPLKLVGQILRHPRRFVQATDPRGWSERSVITGIMQTLDNSMRFVPKRRLPGARLKITTRQDPEHPNPRFLPMANEVTQRLADASGGIAQSWVTEALLGIPVTAHLLGGVVPAADASRGVIDLDHRVFGYENLLVCDGAAIPANPGVNPSLTITAMAERAMAAVPAKPGAEPAQPPAMMRM